MAREPSKSMTVHRLHAQKFTGTLAEKFEKKKQRKCQFENFRSKFLFSGKGKFCCTVSVDNLLSCISMWYFSLKYRSSAAAIL